MTTLTMPPPDVPVTSLFAISSCARFMSSCMRCACCIKPASGPFIGLLLRIVASARFAVDGPDAVRNHARAERLLERLHERIAAQRFLRGLPARRLGARLLFGRAFRAAGVALELDLDLAAE